MKSLLSLWLLLFVGGSFALPSGFVYLSSIDPSIIQSIRYYSAENFVGRRIKGYVRPYCVLTLKAAKALKQAQKFANNKGYSLLVYDCYRPVDAVLDFYKWSLSSNKKMKLQYYPRELKENLFKKGYIARYSGHSRGTSVDLTLIPIGLTPTVGNGNCFSQSRKQDGSLDMGTNFDCLDKKSNVFNKAVSPAQLKNRRLLREIMMASGFLPYEKEWWHFSLKVPDNRKAYNFYVK